jgi:non-homologous end joining protein Ku
MDNYQIIITLIASISSGLIGVFFNYKKEKRKEISRVAEKEKDRILLEIKDLQIKLYQLERLLDEWKDKYYKALQELINVRSELENTLAKLENSGINIDTNH